MVRRSRLALAVTWVATLVMVAAVATSISFAAGTGTPRRTVVQPAAVPSPADRRTDPTRPSTTPAPATTSPTEAPAPSAVPTTVPTTAATTAPPTTVRTTAPAPRTVPTTVARPQAAAQVRSTPPATGGSASDFSLLGYRWNPCHTITVSTTGPDVSSIVSELASITGLKLQMVSGPADITVQWGAVPAGGEIGLTAWQAISGWLHQVGIAISQVAQPYLATVLRHELGHAVGLGHAAHANEIMYPTAGAGSPTDYQAGDLAGLRAIGAAAGGC